MHFWLSGNTSTLSSEKPSCKGYYIAFARSIGGVPTLTDEGVSFYVDNAFDYQAPLYPEEAHIFVDEAGNVQSFSLSHPLALGETLVDNARLLPFDQMQQRIRDMLVYIHSGRGYAVAVEKITFKMAIVNVRDSDAAMYVPAWFIDCEEQYAAGEIPEDTKVTSTLVLNAIDGGRILELPTDISPTIQSQIDRDTSR